MKTSSVRFMNLCPALVMTVAGLVGMSGVACYAQSATRVDEVTTARETTTTRETKVDGLLHLTGPESLSIKVGTTPDPAIYRYGKTIQFTDEAGNVVAREQVVPGTRVTVYTTVEPTGGILTNRVVVHKAVKTAPPGEPTAVTTTVTETTEKRTKANGVLLEKEPDRVLVKTEGEGNVTFMYTRVTEFMDSDGKHVNLIDMVPGLPVQVDFKQVGDRLEAKRITVRGRMKN